MNIWIFNHYAGTPETTAATRPFDLSKALVKKGHEVTIFASSFSEYTFKEQKLKPEETWKTELYDGVRFIWIRTSPYIKNNWRRVMNMISYTWRVYFVALKFKERPDVIIGTCVHPLAVLDAYLISTIKHCRFVYEVTDLWPQTLVDMGKLSAKSPATRMLQILEKFLYKKADKIITLMPNAYIYITRMGIPQDKIFWIPQCIELSNYTGLQNYDGGTRDTFTVMYLGRHGIANALEPILKAAKIVQDSNRNNIRFVFIGNGPEKQNLIKLSADLKLSNIEFRNHVPKSEVVNVMKEADAFILSTQDIPLYKYGISANKLCDYLASGRPVVFSSNSSYNPVAEAKAGLTTAPENPEAMAQAIIELSAMKPEDRIEMGKRGIVYVQQNYDITSLANRMETILK